jgi:hypothetical protein
MSSIKHLRYVSPSGKSTFEAASCIGDKTFSTPLKAKDRNREYLAVLEDAAVLTHRLNEYQAHCKRLYTELLALQTSADVVLETAKQNDGKPTTASLKDMEDLLCNL